MLNSNLFRSLQLDAADQERATPYIDAHFDADHEGPRKTTPYAEDIGHRIFQAAAAADGGEGKMAEVRAAADQLKHVARSFGFLAESEIQVFGSCLVLGVWDGKSDIDFAVQAENCKKDLTTLVHIIAAALKDCGFDHDRLRSVTRARVPVIKYTSPNGYVALADVGIEESCQASLTSRTVFVSFNAVLRDADKVAYERHVKGWTLSILNENVVEGFFWDPAVEGEAPNPPHARSTTALITFSCTTACAVMMVHRNAPYLPRVTCTQPAHDRFRPELFLTDFDISFNNRLGPRNSLLQRAMLQCHPAARPVFLVLKNWSKTAGVNNGPSGYLTSYAFNIMWIYYLQRVVNLAPYVDVECVRTEMFFGQKHSWLEHVPLVPPGAFSDSQLKSLTANLLVDFFHFYGFRFDWEKDVVSLNKPNTTTKEELGWVPQEANGASGTDAHGRNVHYTMCIKDPYEENLSLGRNLTVGRCDEVLTALQKAYKALSGTDGTDLAAAGHDSGVIPDLSLFPSLMQFVAEPLSETHLEELYAPLVGLADVHIHASPAGCITNEALFDSWRADHDTGASLNKALASQGGNFLAIASAVQLRSFGKVAFDRESDDGAAKSKAYRPGTLKGKEGSFEAAVADAVWTTLSSRYDAAAERKERRVVVPAEEVHDIVRNAQELTNTSLTEEEVELTVLGRKLGLDTVTTRSQMTLPDGSLGHREFAGWSHTMGLAQGAAKPQVSFKSLSPATISALVSGHPKRLLEHRQNGTNVQPRHHLASMAQPAARLPQARQPQYHGYPRAVPAAVPQAPRQYNQFVLPAPVSHGAIPPPHYGAPAPPAFGMQAPPPYNAGSPPAPIGN